VTEHSPSIHCSNPRAPKPSEYFEYYGTYVRIVPEGDIAQLAHAQLHDVRNSLHSVNEAVACQVHAPYTWTIKQVVGHLIDTERIFAERLHHFVAADDQAMPGMEQDDYVNNQDFHTPKLTSLVDELLFCRQANILLLQRIPEAFWDRTGIASGHPISVRALAYCLVGHIEHHMRIVKKRVGL
jgi:hypothetical protein